MKRTSTIATCALLAAGLSPVASVHAQSQPRVTVTAGVYEDVKRFSGDPTTNVLDGAALGGNVRIGAVLAPQWRLTLGEELGPTTTQLGPLFSPTKGAPLRQERTRNRATTTSMTVAFYPHAEHRVEIGYVVGATLLHVTRTTDTLVNAATVANSARTSVDNVVGLTLGAEVPILLTGRLSLVPDVRVTAFRLSNPAPSGFTIQPGLGVRWAF